jgi:hypothetical protein
MLPRLTWNSLSSPGWPQGRDPPESTSRVLGLQSVGECMCHHIHLIQRSSKYHKGLQVAAKNQVPFLWDLTRQSRVA